MSVNQSVAHRYHETAIRTANPLQLVVILYDAAISALLEAMEHLKNNNIEARSRSINRSLAVISELQASLSFEAGGEIAGSLDRLYAYMKRRVFRASVDQSAEPLREVVGLLENLRSAWSELALRSKSAPAPASSPTGYAKRPMFAANTAAGTPQSLNISG